MTPELLLKVAILVIIGLALIPVSMACIKLGSGVWWASRLTGALKPGANLDVGIVPGSYVIKYKGQKTDILILEGRVFIRAFGQRFKSFDDLFNYTKDHPDVENPFDKDPLKG